MNESRTRSAAERRSILIPDRRVVMVVSADTEPSLGDVVTNLATVCAETGQRVALLTTAGLGSPESELPDSPPLWWRSWPAPGNGAGLRIEDERARLLTGPVSQRDIEDLLGETGVPGVVRLDLRHFVSHPARVVIRVPDVVAVLLEIVDVVFLEVPSYLSVHHGEGLTPLADVVLVVADRELSTLKEMRQLSAALRRLDAPVVGVALTEGGVELFDWGPADTELEMPGERASHPLDPTEQLPLSGPLDAVPAPVRDELSVMEHARREF